MNREHIRHFCLLPWTKMITLSFTFAEAITDAPFASLKTAGLQSKCREQMKIPTYLKSHTEEDTSVPMLTIWFQHYHHLKSKNRNKTSTTMTISKINDHLISSETLEAVWGLLLRNWKTKRCPIPSLFLQLHLDARRVKTVTSHFRHLTTTLVSWEVFPHHFYPRLPPSQTFTQCPHSRTATSKGLTTCIVRNLTSLRSSLPTLQPPVLRF